MLEGYLEKKGDAGLVKGWKKRFFALKVSAGEQQNQRMSRVKIPWRSPAQDRKLEYHHTSADLSKPLGHVNLDAVTSVTL